MTKRCPICEGDLPCYGSGLSWAHAEAFALVDRAEAKRRVGAHTVQAVRAAGSKGITLAGIARALGLDPTGVDDVEVYKRHPSKLN